MIKRITHAGHKGIAVLNEDVPDKQSWGYFLFHNPCKKIPHICIAEITQGKDGKINFRGTYLTPAQKKRGRHFKRLYVNNSFVPELIEAFRALTEKDREEKSKSDVIDDYFKRGGR